VMYTRAIIPSQASQTPPHSNFTVACTPVANRYVATVSIALPAPSIMFRSFRGVSAIPPPLQYYRTFVPNYPQLELHMTPKPDVKFYLKCADARREGTLFRVRCTDYPESAYLTLAGVPIP